MILRHRLAHKATTANLWRADALAFLQAQEAESVDLVLTSPPYFLGKEYDVSIDLNDFRTEIARVIPELQRILRPNGSLCWQVGNHISRGVVTPLDAVIFGLMLDNGGWQLRNRLIWTFGHGAHARRRFSGRHETVLWYTRSEGYYFDLDAVRVPQKYPGKRHYKGPNKGIFSGNPLGKNPSDVWDIPNVKAGHPEKTEHPCQFPTALAQKLTAALCPPGGRVVDPYMGSGTAGVAALLEGRNFAGCDIQTKYIDIAHKRLTDLVDGRARLRRDAPVRQPQSNEAVARLPAHFARP